MRKTKRILSLLLCLTMVSAFFVGIVPAASAAPTSPYGLTPPRSEGQLPAYQGNPGLNHANAHETRVEEIGTPSSSGPAIFGLATGTNMYMSAGPNARPGAAEIATAAVAAVKGHMTLGANYTTRGVYAAQYAKDLATGDGTDFWMDRILARRGDNPAQKINSQYSSHGTQHEGHDSDILLSRGRALYSKGGRGYGLGLSISSMYTRNSNMGTMLGIAVRDSTGSTISLSDVPASRYNAPSHHASTFTGAAADVTIEQKKFISENNVAVVMLKFINSGSTDQTFSVRATSGLANTASVGDLELTRSNINVTIGATVGGRLAGRHGPDGKGTRFTASSASNLDSGNFTVPAGGTYEVAAIVAVTATEIPEARADYDRFLTMSNLELFQYQTRTYNQYWVDELPYIETPNVAVNKAAAYHWWTMRYNTIDPNVPGYGYQFPTTIEGVDGYNNAIVLTQGMHIQDTGWLRTGRLAYGALLSLGNISFSSAYYDNPAARSGANVNSDNWNSHYSQYVASAGAVTYKIHGGRKDIANRLAYDFAGDATGQLDHMRGSTTTGRNANNYLMSHTIGYVTGNDADDRSITFNGNRKDRAESAYIYGAAKGSSELYALTGNTAKASEMSTLANNISTQIQNRNWCSYCGTFECTDSTNGIASSSRHGGSSSLIIVKSNNLLDYYAEYSVPRTGNTEYTTGANYADGLRYAMYNDEYGLFPYYTGNSNDRHYNSGGTHNHSNINMVTLVRGYIASYKYYDREQKYIKGDYLARVFDWHAWHISSLGDISRMNNNEFYSYGTGGKSGYGTTFSVSRVSSAIPANDPRQNPNPFYEDPYDYFRYSIDHNILGNFNWLFIEGMAGMTPRYDDWLEFNPAKTGYNYYLVDNINYHGEDVTIAWRKPGVAISGANYTYEGTENWEGIPAEFAAVYPEGFTVYMNGERLFTIDAEKWVEFNPNTCVLNFLGGDDAVVTYKTTSDAQLRKAVDVDLTEGTDSITTKKQMVDNFKKVGIDLTQDGEDLTQKPVGGGTVTPSASFTPTAKRTQGWNDTSTTHQHRFYATQATHAEGPPTVQGPIKGTTNNWPYWSNVGTSNATDWYQVVWSVPQSFNTLKLFFFDDLRDEANCIKAPASYTVQYIDGLGNWVDVPDQLRTPGTPMPNFNQVNFEEITTTGLRVTVTKKASRSVAISGFQVFDAQEAFWENTAPTIANVSFSQVEDMEIVLSADVQDDGFPQISGQYKPIYKWEVTNAPAGVTYQLIDADKATAKIVCTLPVGANENTWTANFALKFSVWDGDAALYTEHLPEQQPGYAETALNATVRSDPSLRDAITAYYPIAYVLPEINVALPTLPTQAIAYFSKSGAQYVDVTWTVPTMTAENWAAAVSGEGFKIYGVADAPYAPAVVATIYVRNSMMATNAQEITVNVVAGEEPILPEFAYISFASAGHDSSWLKIKWDDVPATYWISPGTYTMDLDLESDVDEAIIDWEGLKVRVVLNVLPKVGYEITALAPVNLGQFKLGNAVPVLPATVKATWRAAALPDAQVAVTWDVPEDTWTTAGVKTINGTVAETDIPAVLTVNVVDVPAPTVTAAIAAGDKFQGGAYDLTTTASTIAVPNTLTYAWTKVSGPGTVTFGNAAIANTTVTFSAEGDYVLQVAVTDIYAQTTTKTVDVTVKPLSESALPVITTMNVSDKAGINLALAVNAAATTGIPNGALTYAWSVSPVIAGNAIANGDTAAAALTFTKYGTYKVTLVVTDAIGRTVTQSKYTTVGDIAPVTATLDELKELYFVEQQYAGIGNTKMGSLGSTSSTQVSGYGTSYRLEASGGTLGTTSRFSNWSASGVAAAATAAKAVIDNASRSAAEINVAYENLMNAMVKLTPVSVTGAPAGTRNVAFLGGRNVSCVSPQYNDSKGYNINNNQTTGTGMANAWGTYGTGNNNSVEWLQYEWPMGARISADNLIMYTYDGNVQAANRVVYKYLPLDSDTWVTVYDSQGTTIGGTTNGTFYPIAHTFEPFECRALRVEQTKRSTGNGKGVGVKEWQVFGTLLDPFANSDVKADKTALADAIAKYDSLDGDDYLIRTWAAATVAYLAGVEVFLNGDATKAEADAAAAALNAALDNLILIVEPTEMPAIVVAVGKTAAVYMEDAVFTDMAVADTSKATVADLVITGVAAGETTYSSDYEFYQFSGNLTGDITVFSMEDLYAAISAAEALDPTAYTDWASVAAALATANAIKNNPETPTVQAYEDARDALTTAVSGLSYVPVEKVVLKAPSSVKVARNKTVNLSVSWTPANIKLVLGVAMSNEAIATAKVTADNFGSATVTITGVKAGSAILTVKDITSDQMVSVIVQVS